MAYDHEEQEQLDNLKAFWNRWGTPILGLLLVLSLAFAGWRGWQWWQARQAAEAAVVYEQLRQATEAKDVAKAKDAAARLVADFPGTLQAPMGAMLVAKAHLDAGDARSARPLLQWVAEKSPDEAWRHVARLRLAGVLLDEKAYDEALKLVTGDAPEAFAGAYADRRGDVLLAQGKADDARAAYRDAFERLGAQSPLREIVRLKLDALGGAGA